MELRRAHDTCVHKNNSIDDLKKQLSQKISEINKLNSKIDALSQLNRTYNEENKNLSRQLEILLTQNKELLQRALHDKDQYHLEMKDYQVINKVMNIVFELNEILRTNSRHSDDTRRNLKTKLWINTVQWKTKSLLLKENNH